MTVVCFDYSEQTAAYDGGSVFQITELNGTTNSKTKFMGHDPALCMEYHKLCYNPMQ